MNTKINVEKTRKHLTRKHCSQTTTNNCKQPKAKKWTHCIPLRMVFGHVPGTEIQHAACSQLTNNEILGREHVQ